MESDSKDKAPRRPLVSVERQFETDVSTGKTETRLFLKMYFEARDSGLLRELPDDLFKTLCLVATYMDENGNCFPSQAELARHLGIRREAVNRRVQRLLTFRFSGRPILSLNKRRGQRGQWAKNTYRVHPVSGFAIFDREARESALCAPPHTVDSTMCVPANMAEAHTNKKQIPNKKHTLERVSSLKEKGEVGTIVALFHELRRHPKGNPKKSEVENAKKLLEEHGFELAEKIVRYAVREASATNFNMLYFGAVMDYIPRALESFDQEKERVHRRALEAEVQEEEERKRQEELSEWRARPLEERAQIRLDRWAKMTAALGRRPTTEEVEAKKKTYLEQEADLGRVAP